MSVVDITSNTVYNSLSAAITGSAANDVIQVTAGTYVEDFPDITHSLTINATGGLASLTRATPLTPAGRALLNVPLDAGVNLSISGLEISGAARPGANPNGAGILFESGNGNLTVANSWIHNNEDGILAGAPDSHSPGGVTKVMISHSEVSNNGAPPGTPYATNGQDHNLYIGAVTSFTLTDSYIHSVFSQGSEIKSRAAVTTITNNRIFDLTPPTGATGSSYSIDIPDGGVATVTGNIIEKGLAAANSSVIHYGGEGQLYATNSLDIGGNTVINHRSGGAILLLNQSGTAPNTSIPGVIHDNTLYDGGAPVTVFNDAFSPPDAGTICGQSASAGCNTLIAGSGPPLDTTSLASVPAAGGVDLLLLALLGLTAARRRGNRVRGSQRRG